MKIALFVVAGLLIAAWFSFLSPEKPLGGAADVISAVETLEEAYFVKYGKYLQILPDGTLPHYESGTVVEKLGGTVAAGVTVNVYEKADGTKGYEIIYDDGIAVTAKGYGPESLARTSTKTKPTITATSTP